MKSRTLCRSALFLLALLPIVSHADSLDSANTAWILTSTALVLFMTIPGLSLFYAGLVRARNVLSVLMHCFAITCAASLLWLICGYSLAFGDGGSANAWIGNLQNFMFANILEDTLSGGIPESVFAMFQMTFAIITPALIVGAFAERMRFSAVLLFSCLAVGGLRAGHALGLGRRLAGPDGPAGFRRWHRGPYHSRCGRVGGSAGNR